MPIVLTLLAVLLAVVVVLAVRGPRARTPAQSVGTGQPPAVIDSRATEAARHQAAEMVAASRTEALRLRTGALEEVSLRQAAIDAEAALLAERERTFRDRNHHFNQHRHSYKERRAAVDAANLTLDEQMAEARAGVARVAGLDRETAEHVVLDRVTAELSSEHPAQVQSVLASVNDDVGASARALITRALERQNQGHADSAPRLSPLPLEGLDEEHRARLLSSLEAIAGETSVEVAIDIERDQAALRSQDPLNREVARQAALEVVERKLEAHQVSPIIAARRSGLGRAVRDLGERTLWEMEMTGRPELADLVGTLHYRFSYGQNALLHCQETGYLCGTLAAELGLPQAVARQAGMLHDIGKAVDHDVEGSHAIIGGQLLSVFGTPDDIVHAVKAHHFDEEPSTDLAMLTICADAISASRPGARRDTLSAYLARLEQLQTIATRHAGVERAFPLQAGREVRVLVKAKSVKDDAVGELSQNIARDIESEMQYPGVIKVTVIRELQATATAPAQVHRAGEAATAPAELPTAGRRRRRRKRQSDTPDSQEVSASAETAHDVDAERASTT